MGRELVFCLKRLPWYHPDCRHPPQERKLSLIVRKGCDHSFQFNCCMGTVHPPYLSLARLSSGSRSRRGSEETKPSELAPTIGSLQAANPHTISLNAGQAYLFVVSSPRITSFVRDCQPGTMPFRASSLHSFDGPETRARLWQPARDPRPGADRRP